VKLYDLPRNSWFLISASMDEGPFKFDRLDGMYSVCWVKGPDGIPQITHVAAYEDVMPINEPETEIR
jgi:hypothetical protein